MALPTRLLQQISRSGGGGVVLVVGAGGSIEFPTGLKTGAAYSQEAFRKLVADGVLEQDACADPSDLSLLAETVSSVCGGSQRELTCRLPKDSWRSASPNHGHFLAAALLVEGALRHIITLNYDLALQNALGVLGIPQDVAIIKGPEEHDNGGARALIYLHRSVESDEESWVLRKSDLDEAWRDSWEEVVARANLSAPVTVFVGLGSPAAVLTDSVGRVAQATRSEFYLVDPNPDSSFAAALGDNVQPPIPMYWGAFMDQLANRAAQEQIARLEAHVGDLATQLDDGDQSLAMSPLAGLAELDLVSLGKLRAAWLLHSKLYCPEGVEIQIEQVADLLLGLGHIHSALGGTVLELSDTGRAEIVESSGYRTGLYAVHGGGIRPWSQLQSRIEQRTRAFPPSKRPRHVLVAGARQLIDSTPYDLLGRDDPSDLIRGADIILPLGVDEVRHTYLNNANKLRERLGI